MVRIVADVHVALAELAHTEKLEREADGQGRCQHELRDPDRQRDQPALTVKDGGVALVGLVEDRGGRRARDVGRHLPADRLHRPADDLGRDRINGDVGGQPTAVASELYEVDVHGKSPLTKMMKLTLMSWKVYTPGLAKRPGRRRAR